ncbi:muramoyltetrapeptide carboxypeptidase [Actinoplanes sp. NBRC 14428]|nr:muramoyltetrapeptide carboxypeptidase [Actinoplanes sp. NBRC 14428]
MRKRAADYGPVSAERQNRKSDSGLSRRGLLRAGAALAGGTAVGAAALGSPAEAKGKVLKAPKLKAGDTVRVVAPAYPGDSRLVRGQEILEGMGLVVEYGEHVYDTAGYLAGTDENRLADLNAAFRDPKVRAIIGARGGYGSQRIVDGLDIAAVRKDPKVFFGFSDLTVIHSRLWRAARLVSFYGPLATWTDTRTGPESVASMKAALMSTDDIVITRDATEPSSAVRIAGSKGSVARGPLVGGNLTMIDMDTDTDSFPKLDGAIFLFEDTGEAPYSYDRMLTHLRRSGALEKIAGVAVGQFTGADVAPGAPTAAQVVTERLKDLGVPVLGGLRIGHGTGQLTVPIGANAVIDVEAGTLTVEAGVR